MTSGRTWSAKDLDPRTRRMAEEAARLSGMSLEDWLRETVAQRAAEDLPRHEAPRSRPEAEPGNVSATLARLGERIRSIAPQARTVRDAAQQAELEQITERLTRDLQDIDEAARSRVEGLERARPEPPEPPEPDEEAPAPHGIEETLRNIELQISELARRTREDNAARRDARYEELRERLEALRTPRPPRTRRMAEARSEPPPDLDTTLRDIEAQIARAKPAPKPAASQVPPAEPPPRAEIPRAPPRQRPETRSLSAAIADIASRQSFLAGRPVPAEEGTPAAIGALRAEVAVLSDRIAVLGERDSEERADRDGAMLRAEKAALAGQASMSTIAATLGDIRTALVDLSARRAEPAPLPDLSGLTAGIDHLREKVDGLERSNRQGTDSLRRIEARVEAISRVDAAALFKGIEDRLDRLAVRIEVALAAPPRDGSLDALKTEIAALRQDVLRRDAVGAEVIERRMRELVAQIGTTSRSNDSVQLAALESRIEGLAADLARTTPRAAALEEVEERISRLKDSLAEGRRDCVEAAQEAARKAVRELGKGGVDGDVATTLRKDLDEIRSLIAASERTERLDESAVKAKLAAVASHIDTIAATPAPAGPSHEEPRIPEPPVARPRRDLGVVREVAASAPAEERVSVDRRADFIAAARRAVHIAMAETSAPGLPDDDGPALLAAGGGSPFARIGQAIRARRRPLLLAAAALVVAIGALQMFGRPLADTEADRAGAGAGGVVFVNGSMPEPVAQVHAAAVAAALPEDGVAIPVATPAPPAAPRQIEGVDPYVTGSTQPAPPVPMPDVGSDELRIAAMAGDPAAAYRVANLYADGRGTLRDLAQAAAWYQRAADAGLAPAIYRLASLYERGQGVPKDLGKAVALYREAAERGNPGAMYNLAVMLSAGAAGPADPRTAMEWFHAAAEHGVTDSQYNLGVIYARGIGVPANREEAYKWFAVAAAAGDQDAASQRNQVAAGLPAAQLARAKAAVAAFVPRTAPAGVSDVSVHAVPVAASVPQGSVPVAHGADLPADADGRREMVRTVQTLLAARGYDPGPADGFEGPKTKQAVRAFQRSIGAPGTGRIDGALVVRLAPSAG